MPKEFGLLKGEPEPLSHCPSCGAEFRCFLRGLVQSSWRKFLRMCYVCVICENCKEIVGYERPYYFVQTALLNCIPPPKRGRRTKEEYERRQGMS